MDDKTFNPVRAQLMRLDAVDLRAVLMPVFKRASGNHSDERVITYSNESGPALSIEYRPHKNGKRDPLGEVSKIRAEAHLTIEDIRNLEGQVRIVLGPQDTLVVAQYHFAYLPVKGWWRYRDRFQILPPHPEAPTPRFFAADHPYILEAAYTAPNHHNVIANRRTQTLTELRRILPVLLRGPVFQPQAERNTKHWVMPMDAQQARRRRRERQSHLSGNPPRQRTRPVVAVQAGKPIFAQEHYRAPNYSSTGQFSDTDGMPPLAAVDAQSYSSGSVAVTDVLTVPTGLAELLDTYFALSLVDKRRYLRACYWHNMGQFLHSYSASLSLFSDVAAIEVMLPDEGGPHTCSECGFPHYPSITKSFKEFLTKFVPARPERDAFYQLRSEVAHGSALFSIDLREEFGGFYPIENEQILQRNLLHQVCKTALVNWLASRG